MFRQTKGIDTAFRQVRSFSIVFVIACSVLTIFICYKSYQLTAKADARIYILANGKVLEAYSADRKDNIPVEARDHVKMFHQYFFSLDPDEKVINANLRRALYLADNSAKQQYDDLKENGYYANLISGNVSQEIDADSIYINVENYPYYFRYKGKVRIVRPSSIVTRSLHTEGFLRNVARSDHNPHGFLLEKWRTLENVDVNVQAR
jgi:conjugative transposon TraK protein